MCRFIKNRKDRGKKKVAPFAIQISVVNFMSGVLILLSIVVYAVIAVGNTSLKLELGTLREDLTEQINRNNNVMVYLAEQKSLLLTEEQLSQKGLVKVEGVEYASGKEGEVAIR